MPVKCGKFKLNVDLTNVKLKPFAMTSGLSESKKKKADEPKVFVKGDADKFPTKLTNSKRKSVG